MRNIFNVLSYNNIDKAINKIKIDAIYKKYYKNIRVCPAGHTLENMQPMQLFVNEYGLYQLLTNSTKPLAKIFMNKYINEIMPQIRKTGKFILDDGNKQKLYIINKKLNNIKKENIDLLNNQRNVV